MPKTLFFFTSSFPFGTGETFIENEIEYLAEAFDTIIIVSNDVNSEQTRKVPSNVLLQRLPYDLPQFQKTIAIFSVCTILFWKEIYSIKKRYKLKLTSLIFNTLIISIAKKRWFSKRIKNIIDQNSNANDHIYLYSYWANDMALAVASIKNVEKKICRAHRWDIYFEENKAKYLPLRNYLFQNIDEYHSISNDGLVYNKNLLNSNFESFRLSRLGVVKTHIKNQITSNDFKILSVSNLIPVKNIKLLIDALAQVNQNFKWIHIGNGPLRKELEEYANDKIPDNHSFLGALTNNEVKQFMSENYISLFVNTSLSEGIPVSIMEAMSFGIPCMATDVGGTSEIVNNENGVLLPSNPSAQEIADEIVRYFLVSKDEQIQKRKAAYTTWDEKCNAEKNYKAFINSLLH